MRYIRQNLKITGHDLGRFISLQLPRWTITEIEWQIKWQKFGFNRNSAAKKLLEAGTKCNIVVVTAAM